MIDCLMEESTVSLRQLATTSKLFARRLLTIGENRLELLTVEVQEERERLLHAFLLALGIAAFGLLAGLTLTATIVVLLWTWSPWAALLILTLLYAATGFYLYRRLIGVMRNWQTLSASLDQLRKDRACLENILT
ncbi:MAG: phage holin family protein [Limisphaerales bacterium]